MIVFTHVVKGGGNSVKAALKQHFEPDEILIDDANMVHDPLSDFNVRFDKYRNKYSDKNKKDQLARYRMISGHFNAIPYFGINGAIFVTMLRHPVDRLVSNFFFWKGTGPMPVSDHVQYGQGLIQNSMLKENLGILEFAQFDLMRNIYTKGHFREIDMTKYSFVGNFSSFDIEMRRLTALLGVDLEIQHKNINPYSNYDEEKYEIKQNKSIMAQLQDLLSDDIEFFERFAGT